LGVFSCVFFGWGVCFLCLFFMCMKEEVLYNNKILFRSHYVFNVRRLMLVSHQGRRAQQQQRLLACRILNCGHEQAPMCVCTRQVVKRKWMSTLMRILHTHQTFDFFFFPFFLFFIWFFIFFIIIFWGFCLFLGFFILNFLFIF